MTDAEIDAGVADATRAGATPPWTAADLETAALMHTDAALPSMTGQDTRGLAHIIRPRSCSAARWWWTRRPDGSCSGGIAFSRGTLEANGARSTAKALEARSHQRIGYEAAVQIFNGITAELQQVRAQSQERVQGQPARRRQPLRR